MLDHRFVSLRIKFSTEEFEALARLAERELRPIPDQVRVVLREHLESTTSDGMEATADFGDVLVGIRGRLFDIAQAIRDLTDAIKPGPPS